MLSNPFDRPLLQFLQYLNHRPVARLVHVQLGVWNLVIRKPPRTWSSSLPNADDFKACVSNASIAWRFIKEIHGLAPRQFWMHAIDMAWVTSETLLSAYTSTRVYMAVLDHLHEPDVDARQIFYALGARIGVTLARNLIKKLLKSDEVKLQRRIRYHFLSKSLAANVHREHDSTGMSGDLPTEITDSPAEMAFENLSNALTLSMRLASQLFYTARMLRQFSMEPTFLLVSIVESLACAVNRTSLYGSLFRQGDHFVYCSKTPFKRLLSLLRLASSDDYGTDIKSDGLQNYIVTGFERNIEELGDINTEDVHVQFREKHFNLFTDTYNFLSSEMTTIYIAIRKIFYPGSLTPSSYSHLQHASKMILASITNASVRRRHFASTFSTIHDIYKEESEYLAYCERERQLLPYPRDGEKTLHVGLEIEFRDVTFRYPGTTKDALTNISFTIRPGQLVAIVGVNGSGKSSITNLFNRLYDPTEGEILVDGLPLRSYRRADVRRSMAILRQSHTLYPLSIKENIALGAPDIPSSDDDVKTALECGGALSIVEKLSYKYDTVLDPVQVVRTNMELSDDEDDDDPSLEPLKKIQAMEITTDVSGGEGQRLAASRTFLRMNAGGIRFLAADEPTSALDPEGEFELFRKLKHQRGDMTVVFVTHRFGHVTRDADLILCLKDGRLVEQGTHDELMAKGEEYFKLYEIQAQAFSSATEDQVARISDAESE